MRKVGLLIVGALCLSVVVGVMFVATSQPAYACDGSCVHEAEPFTWCSNDPCLINPNLYTIKVCAGYMCGWEEYPCDCEVQQLDCCFHLP